MGFILNNFVFFFFCLSVFLLISFRDLCFDGRDVLHFLMMNFSSSQLCEVATKGPGIFDIRRNFEIKSQHHRLHCSLRKYLSFNS
jgi:hypothetical protein